MSYILFFCDLFTHIWLVATFLQQKKNSSILDQLNQRREGLALKQTVFENRNNRKQANNECPQCCQLQSTHIKNLILYPVTSLQTSGSIPHLSCCELSRNTQVCKKMWIMHSTEYYSVIKNVVLFCNKTDETIKPLSFVK